MTPLTHGRTTKLADALVSARSHLARYKLQINHTAIWGVTLILDTPSGIQQFH